MEMYGGQAVEQLVKAANSSGRAVPSLVMWSNHLTSPDYIHLLDPAVWTVQVTSTYSLPNYVLTDAHIGLLLCLFLSF